MAKRLRTLAGPLEFLRARNSACRERAFRTPRILLIAFAALLLAGCDSGKYREVDSREAIPVADVAARQESPDSITIAVASMLSARESFNHYNDLIMLVQERIGLPISVKYAKKYSDVYRDFKENKIDLGFICSALYVIGRREELFDLLVVPVIEGRTTYRSYVIVPRSSRVERFEDLAGSRFAFADNLSLSGYFYPLHRAGSLDFWSETVISGSHDNSIALVNRGLIAAAAVDGLVFESIRKRRPGDVENIRIVEKSPPFGIPPVVHRKTMNASRRALLRSAFLELAQDPRGREHLDALGFERFETANDTLYVSASEMVPARAVR